MRNLSLIMAAVLAFGCTEDNENADPNDMGVGGTGGMGAGGEGGMGAGGDGGMGGGGEGGMGAGGDGGAGGMGGEGGMGEGGMGGDGPSAACAMACTRLIDCAVDECMNFEAADGPAIDAWCQDACDAIPSFASVANGTETCGDLVAFGRQTLDPAFEMQCMVDPGNLEMNPECDAFGAHIVECFSAVCAPAGDNAEVLTAAYTHICNEAIANGSFGPMEAQALGNAPCDQPPLDGIIQEQVDNSAAFCADGPATDPAVCAAACEVIGPCIPVGSDGEALRDSNRCEQFCLTTANFRPEQWQCIADAPMCGAAFQCLEGAPMPVEPVPECGPYGVRAAECIVEGGCANVEPIQEQTAAFSTTLCNQIVAAGQARPEDLVGIEEAPCDDPRLTGFVAFLTVDTDESGEDGSLAGVCADGLVNSLETCDTACERSGPCFPEDSEGAALRDLDFCTYFCATSSDVAPPIWECLSGVEACNEVGACFQPN